jgi:hypothetical protein
VIRAGAAEERIIPLVTTELVVTGTAINDVVAGTAENQVVLIGPEETVVSRRPNEKCHDVLSLAADRAIIRRAVEDGKFRAIGLLSPVRLARSGQTDRLGFF